MLTYAIQLFAGLYMFVYSFTPNKYYEDMYYINLVMMLLILLGQILETYVKNE